MPVDPLTHVEVKPGDAVRIGIIETNDVHVSVIVPTVPVRVNVIQPGDVIRIGILPPPLFRIAVSTAGEQGLPGNDATDKHYAHEQSVPASVWTIVHNLDKFPSIDVVDSAGTMVRGSYHYVDNNTMTATFSVPFSGKAYLN